MKTVFWQTPLYKFLLFCNREGLEKSILDCGAGGKFPPLALFTDFGYKTYGIDIDDKQLELAKAFENEHSLNLNISKGDMRQLPFEDNSISFAYSFNSIFHMKKRDIAKSISEIKRVLKPGGLCYINFLSVEDSGFGEGDEIAKGEFRQFEYGEEVIHSYFEASEADDFFKDMQFFYKEKRLPEILYKGERVQLAYIDYIVKK